MRGRLIGMCSASYICTLYRGHGHLQGQVFPRGLEIRISVIIMTWRVRIQMFLVVVIQFTKKKLVTSFPDYATRSINIKWTKGCILPFPKKGDLGITKNYWSITRIAITAKIYNALLLSRIRSEIDKMLRIKQNGFQRNRSTTAQILTICWMSIVVREKHLKETLFFSKGFDSIHRVKME